jgi:LacI family transcriptional regulator
MPVTLQDIARQSRVSHTTVSKVLNGRRDAFISEGTRERVLTAARELGYRPNRAARTLATGSRRPSVAFCTEQIDNGYASRILSLIGEAAYRDDYELSLRSRFLGATATADGNGLIDLPVDGLLLFESIQLVDGLFEQGLDLRLPPLVSLGFFYLTTVDHVGVDLLPGATEAMAHLLDIGCRRIAFLTGDTNPETSPEIRCSVYRRAMADAGLPCEFLRITADSTRFRPLAREATREHVRERGRPDAIFCLNDDMALGAYRGLCDHGLRVPEDVALIGCDGVEEAEYLPSPITTIYPPYEEMTALAWEFMKQRLNEPRTPLQSRVLKSRLIVRESTRRP